MKQKTIKKRSGLPWFLSGKEFTRQCRRHEFDPWSMKIPCATGQLSPWATTTATGLWSLRAATPEPAPCNYRSLNILEPVLCGKRNQRGEKPVHLNQRAAPTHPTREKPTQQGRPSTTENKYTNKKCSNAPII